MRIGSADFPELLLNALRDGRLVVLTEAGASLWGHRPICPVSRS